MLLVVLDMALVGELLTYGLTDEGDVLFLSILAPLLIVDGAVDDFLCDGEEVVRFLDNDDDDDDDDG